MYKELIINFHGKRTSVLIEWSGGDEQNRTPCFIVGLSSHYHDKFSPRFRAAYQLVLFDLYWTDESYTTDYIHRLSLDDMVTHIEEIRQALEREFGSRYQKVILLGHSAYGFLCLEYAFRYASCLYGIINVCSPLHFNETDLQRLQEEYLDSNFGPFAPGGPDQRWADYYHYKNVHMMRSSEEFPALSEKEKFVRWYLSMGPILWKEPKLWQNRGRVAAKIWSPWSIHRIGFNQQVSYTRRDINTAVLNHYFDLVAKRDYRGKLGASDVSILWYVGMFDARISLYHFELKNGQHLDSTAIDFYHTETGHWPMCEDGYREFDNKAIQWLEEIKIQERIDGQSRPRSRL